MHKLIEVLQRLVDAGNSVLIIEHNLDIIKIADYLIDLGPDGGDRGGLLVAAGTPDEICEQPGSYTGQYLKKYLEEEREITRTRAIPKCLVQCCLPEINPSTS